MDEPTRPDGAPNGSPGGATTTDERPGPRVTREQVGDFARLRRSTSDRWIGGVAGGVARHLDVDPVVVRAVLAVLALFGGAGLLLYAVLWLLVPLDGRDRAPLELGPDVAKVVVVVVAVLAATVVLGIPWFGGDGSWIPWPLLVVALGLAWLVTRGRRRDATAPSTAAPTGPGVSTSPAAPGAPVAPAGVGTPPPLTTGGPPPPPPAPPRPRRAGPVLFWPVLALLALALGVLGAVDVTADVPLSTYPALGLAVTGLALVLGAFRFRPGGLVALGLVLLLTLGVTGLADAARLGGAYASTTVRPTSAAELQSAYRPDNGEFTLDLRALTPGDLAGRGVAVDMGTGQLTVLLPAQADVVVDTTVAVAGGLSVDDDQTGGGLGFSTQTVLDASPEGGTDRPLALDLDLRLGGVEVRTR